MSNVAKDTVSKDEPIETLVERSM